MNPLPSPTQALAIARTVLASRYADAAYAFAAGSILRGEGTHGSDIDLVVVYDRLPAARREAFVAQGVPIEAFVHDQGTLAWFVDDDVARGRPSLPHMIAEGSILGAAVERAQAMQRNASERLRAGPPPLSPAQLQALRYEITDLVDDLQGERSAAQIVAIGATLYPRLVELALRGRGCWHGTGKWAPRLLARADADLAARFEHAFAALFATSACAPAIALALQEMAPHGGRLFDGDCRTAPAHWRR
ncbi:MULTISPECIES: nucleotidyltransferase domain-containing protein [Xanthomonas translucens group]|uniref:nucleotidyltransferase domain-containing protein n=1 Tax=Xanthomonas translucens group TaxID=3390202 RepID=UPI000AAEDF82|nr:nucleotidyltransferase domain-containing protein [Xanthomonas translucens]UKE46074.1 nucleotidyltransferase domain-containing protein [Xanthomonas translucens pv. cerealis]UKE68424.1 nucleotidyltransferase domain-containing protein [Xanthomonas translucens pv. pistacia]